MTGNQNHSILAHLAVFGRVWGVVSVLEIMVWVGQVILVSLFFLPQGAAPSPAEQSPPRRPADSF